MAENSKRKRLGGIFLSMLKIGAFTFGGGYAMVALLENEFVSKKGWIQTYKKNIRLIKLIFPANIYFF